MSIIRDLCVDRPYSGVNLVTSEFSSLEVADRSWPWSSSGRGPFLDKLSTVSFGHKAEFLTVGLAGHRQTTSTGSCSDFVFQKMPNRKPRAGELPLIERKQEIRLVFDRVSAAAQRGLTRVRLASESYIVTCGYVVGTECGGAV